MSSHHVKWVGCIAGLLNTEEEEFVSQLLATARTELEGALVACDRNKARLLLRLFAALVPCHVLHPSAVFKTLHSVVEAAVQIANEGLTPYPPEVLTAEWCHAYFSTCTARIAASPACMTVEWQRRRL